VIDLKIIEELPDASAIAIGTHDTGQGHMRAQGTEHGGDAARPAESFLAPIGMEENNWRLLTDPFRITPDIAVQHHVAHNQDIRLAEALDELD
jgi:hypothetical protein